MSGFPANAPACDLASPGRAPGPLYDSIPVISVEPLLIDFGKQLVYQSSATSPTITISNRGSADLLISDIGDPMVPGTNKPENAFILSKPRSFPQTISAVDPQTGKGGQLPIEVNFRPTLRGSINATLEIVSNDQRAQRITVNLHGEGVDTPITPDPAIIDFGALRIGSQNQRQQLSLKNTGPADVSIFDAAKEGMTPDAFDVSPVSGRTQMGTIGMGRAGLVDVTYLIRQTPAVSEAQARFQVLGSGLQPVVVKLKAQAVWSLFTITTDEPGGMAFRGQNQYHFKFSDPIGAPGIHRVTVSNATAYNQTVATIQSDNPALIVDGVKNVAGVNLNPGESASFFVRFVPTMLGTLTGHITITASGVDGTDAELQVDATAVDPPLGGKGVACAIDPHRHNPPGALPLMALAILAALARSRRPAARRSATR